MKIISNIIEGLFSNELSNHNWSNYTTPMIIDVVTVKYRLQNPKSDLELKMFLKKLRPSLSIEEALVILTDVAYGKIQG